MAWPGGGPARLSFWGWAVVLTVASLTPVEHLPPLVFDLWDKAQHALGFAALALLGSLAYPLWREAALVAGLLAHGAAIEWAQAATGWRHGDLADWVADGVGVAVGVLIARAVRRIQTARG